MGKKNGLVPKLRFPEFRDADEWEEKPFKKLLSVGNGRDHKHLPDGEIPVYGSGGYMRSVNDYLYDGESVCIGRKGTIDKPFFLKGKFWTVDTLFYTHSFKDCIPHFIYLLFQNIEWKKHNEAGGVPSLSKTNIEKIPVLVPKKILEQKKISNCFSSLDALIAAQAEKIDALKTHKKGLMQQLFPHEGETVPRLRFPEFREAEEWEKKTIGKIGEVVTGNTPSTTNRNYYGGDIMFASPADISESRFVSKTSKTLSSEGLAIARNIPAHSILFVCIGSTIGKVAQNAYECATNQQINVVIPFDEYVNSFIYFALNFSSAKMASLAGKQAVPIINKSLFSSSVLVVPSDKEEQQKIGDCLSSLDALIAAQVEKINALNTHKKGLMQQLFPSVESIAS